MEFSLRTLATLLHGKMQGDDCCVSAVVASSAAVAPGGLFVAVSGTKADGHSFVADAFSRGATAAVVERPEVLGTRPGIVVANSRQALSALAGLFADTPALKMKVVALTGTNGKTTTNWLIYNALEKLGLPSIRIGTIGVYARGVFDLPGELTTPDPISLHHMLAQAHSNGVRGCVIETSSHALDQCRVEDLYPDVAVFSNLTRDHLDYHGSMERYFEAKVHLFTLLCASEKKTRAAVINLDDSHGGTLWGRYRDRAQDFTYGNSSKARVRIKEFAQSAAQGSVLRLSFDGQDYRINTPLIGLYNGYNLAAAFASCVALGFEGEQVAAALAGLHAAPGRLEAVAGPGFSAYVDYAHTPDALERALEALRPVTPGTLWVVFGCGGDRDRGKRPQMGAIAKRLADRVVVTSDNPRTEEPLSIIREIANGLTGLTIEPDRARAIEFALSEAKPGDVVLIAGKGHEDYQILGREKIHFSDREVAQRAIDKRSVLG
jgi:UDP-N-acetylmuramoyl-L-alanyl-D-glutamate--2,6-diaminopimelate ligase